MISDANEMDGELGTYPLAVLSLILYDPEATAGALNSMEPAEQLLGDTDATTATDDSKLLIWSLSSKQSNMNSNSIGSESAKSEISPRTSLSSS